MWNNSKPFSRENRLNTHGILFFILLYGMIQPILPIVLTGCFKENTRHIIIESDPPGAKVFLENNYVGVTPLAFKQDQKKINYKERLYLVLKGYHDYRITTQLSNVHHYTLVPLEKNIEIQLNHIPDLLMIDKRSYPSKKKIRVSLSLGEHYLFAYKQDYPFLEHRFQVTPNSDQEIKLLFSSINTHSRLQLTSIPKKAAIYYQDHLLGITPLILQNLSTNPFLLVFKHPGYEEKSIYFRLSKREFRAAIARLNPLITHRQIIWKNYIPGSQITINEKIEVPRLEDGEKWTTSVSTKTNNYQFMVSYPDHYLYKGEVTFNSLAGVPEYVVVPIRYQAKIPNQPKKILETQLETYDTVLSQGNYFFFSDYDRSEIRVYDLSFNLIRNFSFEEVGDRNSPHIMTGFQYPGAFLLKNRIITSSQIYSFPTGHAGLINPVYLLLLPKYNQETNIFSSTESQVAVFDNGDHRIKFFDLGKGPDSVPTIITAQNYFTMDEPSKKVKQNYLLPLRFSQAIRLLTSEQRKEPGILFIDAINRDLKTYDNGESSYFLSEFEPQPNNPQSLTAYHDLVLIGDSLVFKIWVYDWKGNFIHNFNLFSKSSSPPRYLFVKGNRLYTLGETVSIYSLE